VRSFYIIKFLTYWKENGGHGCVRARRRIHVSQPSG